MRTYNARVNITLSADEAVIKKARAYARDHGTTLNALIRRYLAELAAAEAPEAAAAEFERIARAARAVADRPAWTGREDLYRDRLGE